MKRILEMKRWAHNKEKSPVTKSNEGNENQWGHYETKASSAAEKGLGY